MKIIGIDPGTKILGFSVIEMVNSKPNLLIVDSLKLQKITDHYEKLEIILTSLNKIICEFKPDEMSIESPFYGENIQTMFKLGRAQGVAIAAAMSNNVKVFEYTPRQIKQSITGNGNASKEQVAKMILYLLNTKTNIETMDETDAIAIALTHYFQKDRIVSKNNYSNWNDFIKQNPNKIK